MSQDDSWSPDEPSGAEVFEQGDEALDEELRLDPDFIEGLEQDPSLDPALQVDGRELEEAGLDFDDPEAYATLDGGSDDPDGPSERVAARRPRGDDETGWDLDEPLVGEDEADEAADEADDGPAEADDGPAEADDEPAEADDGPAEAADEAADEVQ